MSRRNAERRILSMSRLMYCVIVMLIIMTLLGLVLTRLNSVYTMSTGTSSDYSDMWTYADTGSIVDFDQLRKESHISIHRRTNGAVINNMDLCFYSKNIYFTMYLDDTVIYDFHPDAPDLFGKAYGLFPHAVAIPVLFRDGDLYIEIDNIYPDNTGIITGMRLDSSNHFIISEIQSSAIAFIMCLMSFAMGATLMIIGVIGKHFGTRRFEIVSMGTFAMISSLWILSETSMFSILTGAPIAAHFMDYMTLILLGLPALLFAAYATEYRSKPVIVLGSLSTIVVLVNSLVSTLSGRKDHHQLLWVSHIHLSLIGSLVLFLIIRSIFRKTLSKQLGLVLVTSLTVMVATGVADIINYLTAPPIYAQTSFFKYSIFAVILLAGIYEFFNISEMSRRGRYAEIMEELAYKDALTGLTNRTGFNKALKDASKGTSEYTLIMIDLNYLKKVNDDFGHNLGDLYIKTTAEYISKAFSKGERCFRIGGDEFFVMAEYPINDPRYQEGIKNLEELMEGFNENPPCAIPLKVAYGAAEFDPSVDKIEEQVRISDERMYEMKVEMKALRKDD
jgi:diguanylate cyclase (GGDEF)-like protein